MNEAYAQLLERQARQGRRMLPDRALDCERIQRDQERRYELAVAFGEWIAKSLGPWDWFVNPITFRDRQPDSGNSSFIPDLRPTLEKRKGRLKIFSEDPRIRSWEPDTRGLSAPGPPVPDRALLEIKDWLFDLEQSAGTPVRWMIGEEFGDKNGRYHCHILIAGVKDLRRDAWWKEAFERFGRTRIVPFDADKGGAFYAAKYASKKLGTLHFGGPLPDAPFSAHFSVPSPAGHLTLTPSAQMSREDFRRSEFIPRGFTTWRSKR